MITAKFLACHVAKHHEHMQSNANPTVVTTSTEHKYKAWSERHQWSTLGEVLHKRCDSGSCRS